ncbi:MAG TPA: long-chain fatty acid--CoA ligase [Caldithrix abyssi]|uniref:Long-chain fatty acid--CoA ligase n=1 Tax=Caldithrix abyssi TaxID=187145 RepID=A0A7V1M0H7_CALAY|nr:long-chain fatty acid--CoA ligase [Caldithrix abyssi]
MKYSSLGAMFLAKREENPHLIAYRYKEDGSWKSVTYGEAVNWGERIACGLANLGIKKGDRIAIVSGNRIEWAMIDYATQTLGAVLVTIYPSLLKEQVKYILNDSETKVVFAENDVQINKINETKEGLKHTEHFFVIDGENSTIKEPWKTLTHLGEEGAAFLEKNPGYLKEVSASVGGDDWATIIYTSGTTGEPKGAILTNNNLLSNVEAGLQCLPVTSDDEFLSFLPLSHVFERMAGHFLAYYCSATIAYAESIDTVPQNMGEIKPMVMASVPRLYEKMYARVLDNVEMGSPLKQKIFHWAVSVGREYVKRQQNKQKIGSALQFKRNLAYKLVFSKLAERVGGRIKFFISGGAPLSPEIAEFFGAAGLMILEGYGLTETSPLISVNRVDKFRFGTVGPVAPGVEVKIAEDGEICARGPNIMVGYYKKEAETKEAIDEEGWFHTGDIGIIDEDGFLKITDRKKNIIVTAGGKNIAPQPIENIMITSKYIEQFVMIGDRRKFCSAVIVASEENLGKWAEAKGLSYKTLEDLNKLPGVKELIQAEIDRLSAGLASYETIKKFVLAKELFSIENGTLTPSLKVKRKVVEEMYADEIEELYK